MELKEYIGIVRKNLTLFIGIIIIIISACLSFFYFQAQSYEASLVLNITRQGKETSADYHYDSFYRLQADERFADTVVEWLKSPRIVADILKGAGVAESIKIFPQRRSSQIVAVEFNAAEKNSAEKIASTIVKTASARTEELNLAQNEENWFMIMAHEPIIAKKQPPYAKISIAALLIGLFIAFWAVMLKHYIG